MAAFAFWGWIAGQLLSVIGYNFAGCGTKRLSGAHLPTPELFWPMHRSMRIHYAQLACKISSRLKTFETMLQGRAFQ